MDQRIAADIVRAQPGKAVIPERRDLLHGTDPALEPVTVLRAIENQQLGRRKALPIAPRRRLALARAGDEILQIALPAAVEVGIEHHFFGAGQPPPAGIVDRPHVEDIAGAELDLDQHPDRPQRKGVDQPPQQSRLERADRHHVVLQMPGAVLAARYFAQALQRGMAFIGHVALLSPAQQHGEQRDQRGQAEDRAQRGFDPQPEQLRRQRQRAGQPDPPQQRSDPGEHDQPRHGQQAAILGAQEVAKGLAVGLLFEVRQGNLLAARQQPHRVKARTPGLVHQHLLRRGRAAPQRRVLRQNPADVRHGQHRVAAARGFAR